MPSLIFLKECNSSNEEILHFLDPKKPDFHAVYTFNQIKGKGQYGNSWECAENLNLAFTLAVPANKLDSHDHFFNFRTAVLLRNFLANMTKIPVEIKWPNDIIIGNKKISGILTEKKTVSGTPYFILGIGINILQEDFSHLPKAGSILTQTGLNLVPETTANDLFEYLTHHLQHPVSTDDLLKELNQHLFRKDMVSVFETNELRQNGIIQYVDEEGFLWVNLENEGLRKFFHKEIELLY